MKQGEKEAKDILEKKGIRFNPNYHDDNSCEAIIHSATSHPADLISWD
jgi:hypothetical protein